MWNKKYLTHFERITVTILLFLFLSTLCIYADSYEILDETTWKVSIAIYIENPSSRMEKIEFVFPIMPDDYPAQEVISKSYPSMPLKIVRGIYENSAGVWRETLLPGQIKLLTFTYVVKTRHIRWDGPVKVPSLAFQKKQAKYLCDQPMLGSSSQVIKNAARSISGDEKYPYYKALIFYDHLISHYQFNPTESLYGACEALGKKTIQCGDAALLYVALLRASGIPSRFVGGLYITPGVSDYSEFHAWTEVLLPGYAWAAVDPTLGRFDSGHRFRCFLERRAEYISLWKGNVRPFLVISSRTNERQTRIRSFIKVNQISKKDYMSLNSKFDRIDAYYKAFERPSEKKWKQNFSRTSMEYYHRGRKFEAEHLYQKACEEYFTAIKESPDFLDPVKSLLRLYDSQELRSKIYQNFKRIVEKDSRVGALIWYAFGDLHRRNASYSASSIAFDKAERLGFIHEDLFLSRMCLYAVTKEVRSFDNALYSYMTFNDRNIQTYRKALLFYQDLEKWDHCLYWASMGRKKVGASSIFYAMEGFAYMHKGDLKKARLSMMEAIQKDPSIGWYHCILGWILLKQGDRAGGRKEIEQGISLGSGVANPEFFRSLLKE